MCPNIEVMCIVKFQYATSAMLTLPYNHFLVVTWLLNQKLFFVTYCLHVHCILLSYNVTNNSCIPTYLIGLFDSRKTLHLNKKALHLITYTNTAPTISHPRSITFERKWRQGIVTLRSTGWCRSFSVIPRTLREVYADDS